MGVEVSHLLFANDTLVLYDACKENLKHLSWVFMLFDTILRLKINLEKNKLIHVGVVSNMEDFARVLGYKVGILLTTYLGLPLGAPFKSYKVWDGWKKNSKGLLGGRESISQKVEDRL